jgi:hypothetical protein
MFSVLSELREHAATDRELSFNTTESLKTDISAICKLCTEFSKQLQDNKKASEWQEKFSMMQIDHQVLLQETDRIKEELDKMRNEAETQLQQRESLQQELISLRAAARATDESNNRVENLEKAKLNLQRALTEKETCVQKLEDKLKEVNEAMSAQNNRLKDQERKFNGEREKHTQVMACYRRQREQELQEAKNEGSAKAQAEYQHMQKRLQGAEKDRAQLQEKLEQAKRDAKDALRNSCSDEDTRQMRDSLAATMKLAYKLSEDLKTAEQSKSDLKAKLKACSDEHTEVTLLQQVVQKLAKDQEEAVQKGEKLWELLEVQKKLDRTWEWHKSEVDSLERKINSENERTAQIRSNEASRSSCKVKDVPETSKDGNRRVTIQSPATDDGNEETTVHVSVEQERVVRRQSATPRGIMKSMVVRAQEGRPEEQDHTTPLVPNTMHTEAATKQRAVNRTTPSVLVSRSAYNRPVVGTHAIVGGEVGRDHSSAKPESVSDEVSSMPEKRKRSQMRTYQTEGAEGTDTQPPIKRPRSLGSRTKVSRSMSEYFIAPVSEELANKPTETQTQPRPQRGGALERRERSIITYGKQSRSNSSTSPGSATLINGSEMLSENREYYLNSFNLRS